MDNTLWQRLGVSRFTYQRSIRRAGGQPRVLRFDPSLDPIVRLALSGERELDELRTVADRWLKPRLESIRGVAAAKVRGGLDPEVVVQADEEELAAHEARVRAIQPVPKQSIAARLCDDQESLVIADRDAVRKIEPIDEHRGCAGAGIETQHATAAAVFHDIIKGIFRPSTRAHLTIIITKD